MFKGGVYSDIFIHMKGIFWGQNFKISIFWGVFRKKWGYPPPPVRGCMLTESVLLNRVMKWGKGFEFNTLRLDGIIQ